MAETLESRKQDNSELMPDKMPSPKRGALPTPKAEIEKAQPYTPGTDQRSDKSPVQPVSADNVDREEDSHDEHDYS